MLTTKLKKVWSLRTILILLLLGTLNIYILRNNIDEVDRINNRYNDVIVDVSCQDYSARQRTYVITTLKEGETFEFMIRDSSCNETQVDQFMGGRLIAYLVNGFYLQVVIDEKVIVKFKDRKFSYNIMIFMFITFPLLFTLYLTFQRWGSS